MADEPLLNTDDGIKVLVIAIDASAQASRVVSAAARIARTAADASVHLVHVFRTSRLDRARAGAPPPPSDAMNEARDHLDSHARSARRQCRNTVVTHLPVGDPAGEVLRIAGELRADMLVVGTHDYVGFERLLLGSIAETMMRKARCSVLVVRAPAYDHH